MKFLLFLWAVHQALSPFTALMVISVLDGKPAVIERVFLLWIDGTAS